MKDLQSSQIKCNNTLSKISLKNPRKLSRNVVWKKALRMLQNSLKTKLIRAVWGDARPCVDARLAVHIVLGWNARPYKRAWPAMHFYRELPAFNAQLCTICMASHALLQVLSKFCTDVHSRPCRNFRPRFLIPWLLVNSSSLLSSFNSSLEPSFRWKPKDFWWKLGKMHYKYNLNRKKLNWPLFHLD